MPRKPASAERQSKNRPWPTVLAVTLLSSCGGGSGSTPSPDANHPADAAVSDGMVRDGSIDGPIADATPVVIDARLLPDASPPDAMLPDAMPCQIICEEEAVGEGMPDAMVCPLCAVNGQCPEHCRPVPVG